MPVLRPAANSDIPAITNLIDAAYRDYVPAMGGRRPRPMDDDYAARVRNGQLFVVEGETGPAAAMTLELHVASVHIFNFAVDPAMQGQGLLRLMLDHAERTARSAGKPRLTLYTNVVMTRNREIYAHLGFREVREEVTPAGYHIVFMERDVGRA